MQKAGEEPRGMGGSYSALVQIYGQNQEKSNTPSFTDQREIIEVKMMEKSQKRQAQVLLLVSGWCWDCQEWSSSPGLCCILLLSSRTSGSVSRLKAHLHQTNQQS